MVQSSALALLLRAIPRALGNSLISRCRRLWMILWRLLQRCIPFLSKRWRSRSSPSGNAFDEIGGNNQQLGVSDARPVGDTQILASLLPTHTSPSGQVGLRSISQPSLINSSSGISVNIIPPDDDAVSVTSSQFERRLSRGDSMTTHSGNDMSNQTLQVLPSGTNGSRASLVLPASPSLAPGDDEFEPGASRDTGFSQKFSEYIQPLMPYEVPRYKRQRYIKDEPVTAKVSAYQDEFSLGELPTGWKQVAHPEGQPYFYHAEKRIITECWIWDPQMSRIFHDFIDNFEDFTRSRNVTQPDDVDLVLEINIEDGINWCGYYYVSASTHSVFWLEPFDISDHVSEVRGVISPTHIKLYLEFQYWFHWDLFPNVCHATDHTYDLVANTIADARTDVQSSRSSTVNMSKEDLKEMAEIVEGMKNRKASASHWCLGRFMQLLIRDRFFNYHGQYGARLDCSQSVHGDEISKRTWFIKIFSPLLLSAPNVHLQNLNELWVDKITLKARWVKFFAKMNSQWGEHIVHASILLNANVGFLSIPSIDPSNNGPLKSARTPAQIVSYLSIVFSFASMLLALMLVRQHKAKERDSLDIDKYHKYVHKHAKSKYGFERLAIVYSLPYALLTWGMATFLAAFLLMCFVRATLVVRSIVAISTICIFCPIVWCIWIFWEETHLHLRRRSKPIRSWLVKKIRNHDSATSERGDDGYETESTHNNSEMGSNGTDGTSLTEQEISQGNKLHSWLTWVKSCRRNRWRVAIGKSRLSGENNKSSV